MSEFASEASVMRRPWPTEGLLHYVGAGGKGQAFPIELEPVTHITNT